VITFSVIVIGYIIIFLFVIVIEEVASNVVIDYICDIIAPCLSLTPLKLRSCLGKVWQWNRVIAILGQMFCG